MDFLIGLIKNPFIALFITITLGYLFGKIKYRTFVLGGIAGSLIMGVVVGQLNIKIPSSVGPLFFALFIYAVGYQGGAQFFKSINRRTLVELISASLTCVLGLGTVLLFAWWFNLDKGIAAGLAAGGLTQSAMIGSSGSAIAHLGLSETLTHTLQTNVAVGYAVCYIFGSFGPILLLATVFPLMMRWNLRKEAINLAAQQTHGDPELEPGQFSALGSLKTRVFQIKTDSKIVGKTSEGAFADTDHDAGVEAILRDDKMLELKPDTVIKAGDIVAITAKTDFLLTLADLIGPEVSKPDSLKLIEQNQNCVLTNKSLAGKTIAQLYQALSLKKCYGIFVNKISRFGDILPLTRNLKLQKGDEIELVGKAKDVSSIGKVIGSLVSAAPVTDFVFFGIGMALGFLLGLITFSIFGVDINLGSGVGCLLSGLVFGWLRANHPRYGALPTGASNFLRDFGLAVFVASVGITAGPEAVTAIKEHGMQLFILGIGVTLIPQILTFFISYYALRIRNPITLLATIAGGRSANPGFAAILEKAGNSTPVVPFTATYALANIWLTLWGPVVVALVATLPAK